MISCEVVQDFLLEVDLDGVDESDVGVHLRECGVCSAVLTRLEDGELALQRSLADLAATVAPGADPAAAREAVRVERHRRAIRWRVMVPLAAAVLGGVAFFGPRQRVVSPFIGGPEWALPVANLQSIQPVVSSSSHQGVVVLPTDNEDITVIWFME